MVDFEIFSMKYKVGSSIDTGFLDTASLYQDNNRYGVDFHRYLNYRLSFLFLFPVNINWKN